ncbi:hypothetical protein [Micromonospora inyonensis]|uniref:Uncharacterized protein n=1 Tax=Micromonospora inyonensis TaxID=47866 RepID=A0A1C6RWP8_9ACTN|nr:hypothetical protein [Micromonospora inyonensis]SCL12807.1 hypothetical protein GA0074694_0006 [Micromonospora inyonensis]SCL21628.1 hypothetical protein GA0074694_3093 [Micromonospora inyonensis]
MNTATTVDCPLCTVTVLIRETDPAEAAVAAADALEEHLVEHHQGEQ